MAKVNYDKENLMKCNCPNCPVQTESKCTMGKMKKMEDMKKQQGGEEMKGMPDPKGMFGLYCAKEVGKATCDDLDENKACICAGCPVATDNNLQSTYYCLKGDADEIG